VTSEKGMRDREERLLEAFLGGSEGAFEELVSGCREKLYRIVMRIVQNHEDALEIVQDSLVKAYRGISGFRKDSSFSTWLISIGVREAMNKVKRDKFRNAISLHLLSGRPSESFGDPEESAERSILETKVREAVDSLPPAQRAVFTMKHYEDLKISEIAQLMGTSEGAVKANYFHAVKKLRNKLSALVEKE
jgi:RNA polymerase sigma-70 factor (ECF subfamily)